MYGSVCVTQQRLWPIFRDEPQKRYHRGLPGEISARKATAECGAISGMMGLGCPAPVIQKVLHFTWRSKMQAKQFGPVKKHNVLWECCSNNLPSLFSPLFWLLKRHRLCLQTILGEICLMVLWRVFPLIRNRWFFISITSKDRHSLATELFGNFENPPNGQSYFSSHLCGKSFNTFKPLYILSPNVVTF